MRKRSPNPRNSHPRRISTEKIITTRPFGDKDLEPWTHYASAVCLLSHLHLETKPAKIPSILHFWHQPENGGFSVPPYKEIQQFHRNYRNGRYRKRDVLSLVYFYRWHCLLPYFMTYPYSFVPDHNIPLYHCYVNFRKTLKIYAQTQTQKTTKPR